MPKSELERWRPILAPLFLPTYKHIVPELHVEGNQLLN